MCGIYGAIGLEDKKLVQKMGGRVAHRGPDDTGYFQDKDVCLGHKRLSIIDVGGGRQPLSNEEGSIWLVGNGEIYNYRELSKSLKKKGHRFKTASDNEVIIHLFEEYGDEFIQYLEGMFAFALYDSRDRTLILARDRMGIKPVYYTLPDDVLLFASEMKSLLAYEELELKVSKRAVRDFLQFRFTPHANTLLEGVFKLPPGHMLRYSKKGVELKRYWSLGLRQKSITEKQAIARLEELLTQAVAQRLMSEVPLGAFLSGGLDSSLIVALMSKIGQGQVKTFTAGFEEEQDEYCFAREIADHFGTKHQQLKIEYPHMSQEFAKILWHLDEPVADPAILPTYFISELTKKHVTVALLGEGADELFAGYQRYCLLAGPYERLVRQVPVPQKLFDVAESIVPESIKASWFKSRSIVFTRDEAARLMKSEVNGKKTVLDEQLDNTSFLLGARSFDTLQVLPNYQLARVDKLTMSSGLEARVPFLDHRLVDLASSLPQNLLVKGVTGKYLLRKLAKKYLPKESVWERKRVFFVPIKRWFEEELAGLTDSFLQDSTLVEDCIIDKETVGRLLQANAASTKDAHKTWMVLMLEMWNRIFIHAGGKKPGSTEKLTAM